MKRIIAAVLMICVMLCLCSCGKQTEEEQLYEKYKDIISSLEAEDYDMAISNIEDMKPQDDTSVANQAVAPEIMRIEDYLVTVDLTADNFADYFEFVCFRGLDMWGEKSDALWYGLRSKKFDEGLILYDFNNKEYFDKIQIEFYHDVKEYDGIIENPCSRSLDYLLKFSEGFFMSEDSLQLTINRISGSRITYVRPEFVSSYEIERISDPNGFTTNAYITLMNGETIKRVVNPDYPY